VRAALNRALETAAAVVQVAEHEERRSLGIGKDCSIREGLGAGSRRHTHLEPGSAETRSAAHRFYERELPSRRSICFRWEL
jgi:hypothetical protein